MLSDNRFLTLSDECNEAGEEFHAKGLNHKNDALCRYVVQQALQLNHRMIQEPEVPAPGPTDKLTSIPDRVIAVLRKIEVNGTSPTRKGYSWKTLLLKDVSPVRHCIFNKEDKDDKFWHICPGMNTRLLARKLH